MNKPAADLIERANMCLEGRDNTMSKDDRIKDLIVDLRDHISNMGEWQTMESAPKDGTKIIGCKQFEKTGAGHIIGGDVATVEWLWHDELNDVGAWHRGGGFDVYGLTHWQPLPSLPNLKTQSEAL